ncbi:MAG: bifunctional serine/threonine-protein kinase/formylglycine-generating enzyme family protein [Pirellula sp.]|nr:bifunctional serine/threonine-protein kinase/formylglycine-generating enzyme family protein [Pirellula sp.]
MICSAFEESWKNGTQLSIRECVSWAAPAYQRDMLYELILVEKECREFHPPPTVEAPNEFLMFDSRLASAGTTENFANDTIRTESTPYQIPLYIDRFAIHRFLGRGNYGDVYEAEDVSAHRRVAIKVATDANKAQRTYAKEAENANKVTHPGIVQIYEVGAWRGLEYLVSELIHGEPLGGFCAAQNLNPIGCARIVSQIALAMAAAHSRGVVHRDLKPSNIMIEVTGLVERETLHGHIDDPLFQHHRVRVLDFGIAKLDGRETKLTRDGDLLGTPHYMSPEQASGRADSLDGRSDIYSMGVVLFELLTGKLPFEGSESVVIHSIRTLKPPSVRTIRPDIPSALESILSRCLEIDPANRYQTAKDLSNDLDAWVDGRKPRFFAYDERRKVAIRLAWTAAVCILIGVGVAAFKFVSTVNDQSRLMSNAPPSNQIEPKASAASLSNWVRQGNLSDLARWLQRTKEPSSNLILSEIDELRLAADLNEVETDRLEFLRVCIAEDSPSGAERIEVGLGFLNSLELSQFDAIESFLNVAPTWMLDLFLSLPVSDLDDAKRQYLYRGVANQCKSKGDGERILQLLKASETPELPYVVSAMVDTAKQHVMWQSKIREFFYDTVLKPTESNTELDHAGRWKAKCALVAYGLGEMDIVDDVLGVSQTPQARNYFLYWLSHTGLPLDRLADRMEEYRDDWRSTGVIAAVNLLPKKMLTPALQEAWTNRFQRWYREHPSANARSAIRSLLQKWGMEQFVSEVDSLPRYRQVDASRNWYINSQGMQMNIIRGPVEFMYLKNPIEKTRVRKMRIDYSFAYSDQVVSEIQFARFRPERFPNPTNKPAVGIDYFEAIAYCDWLSAQDGLDKGESISWIDATNFNLKFLPGGYRPPATEEWDYFARAGTISSFDYGEKDSEYYKAIERGLYFGPICHDHTGDPYLEWSLPGTMEKIDSEVKFDTKMHGLWTRCLVVPSYTPRILKSNHAGNTALRVFVIVK